MRLVNLRYFRNYLLIVMGLFFMTVPFVSAQTVDVAILDFAFAPQEITIEAGTTVRWTNLDEVAHTTTSDGNWDSGNLATDETFEFTFTTPGEFAYICTIHPFMTGTVIVQQSTDVDDEYDLRPGDFRLKQNYPNPFNPVTRIDFTIPRRTVVTLDIYSVLGTKIKTLSDAEYSAGTHTVTWDGTDQSGSPVASGIYFYSIKAGDFKATEKMVLMR